VGRHDLAAVTRLPSGVDAVITHDAAGASSSSSTTTAHAADATTVVAAAAAAASAMEWPTAVYTPEGPALAAAFPARPVPAAAVGYRETGDEEAEARDAAVDVAAAAAAGAAAASGGGEGGSSSDMEGRGGEAMSAAAFDVTLPGVLLAAEAGGTTLRASDGALHRFLCPHPEEEGGRAAMQAVGGARRRTSYLSIEGRVYTVRDLWPVYEAAVPGQEKEEEEGKAESAAVAAAAGDEKGEPRRKRLRRLLQRRQGQRAVGTEIELTEPFHRTVTPEEAGPATLGLAGLDGAGGGVRMLAALRPVFEPEGGSGGGRQWAHLLGTLNPAGAVGCLAVNALTHHVVLGYAGSGTYEILACERYRRGWENEEGDDDAGEDGGEGAAGGAVVVVE
jgi:hypothetical protein